MMLSVNFAVLKKHLKKFKQGVASKAGRNATGKITTYHRGGGLKRTYRFIDF